MSANQFMLGVIGFIVTLSILVVIHEFGHYAAARMCGVKVLAFSMGFGPVLWRRTDKRGCEWRLSAVPFGGYVAMLDEKSKENFPDLTEAEYKKDAFETKSVWQRLLIVAAGPLMNLVLAVIIYAGVAMAGTYEPSGKVGEPPQQTQAQMAGVQRGWKVVAVGKDRVQSFSDITMTLVKYMGERNVPVTFVDTSLRECTIDFSLENLTTEQQADMTAYLGLHPYEGQVIIGQVEKDGPADRAGVKAGDVIEEINGSPVEGVRSFIDTVRIQNETAVVLTLKNIQTKAERTVTVQPQEAVDEKGNKIARIGVRLGSVPDLTYTRDGFFQAIGTGFKKTCDMVELTAVSIAKMFTGKTSTELISGPLMIGSMAGQTMQYGVLSYMLFLALISVNLGFLNLLPIPLLDGGHILFYLYEMVAGRQPGPSVIEWSQKVGMFIVAFLLVLGLTNDLTRILG